MSVLVLTNLKSKYKYISVKKILTVEDCRKM